MINKYFNSCTMIAFLTLVIIVSKLVFMIRVANNKALLKYDYDSQPELREKYLKIVDERRSIYQRGIIFGFIFSLIPIFYFKTLKCKIFGVIVTIYTVSTFFYLLSPKSDYMVYHLDKKEDRVKWITTYKFMQNNCHSGLLIGIIVALILLYFA